MIKKLTFVIIIILLESICYFVLNTFSNYSWPLKETILKDKNRSQNIKYFYNPPIGYNLNPNYTLSNGIKPHNNLGFRGDIVDFIKPSKTIRILCLGSSTTYGFGITDNNSTYPQLLEEYLNNTLSYRNDYQFEVINAGIEGINMLEVYNQYIFKYRYFQSDIVIIHEGINDANAYFGKDYIPDYSQINHIYSNLVQPPHFLRFILHSNIITACFLLLNIEALVSDETTGNKHLYTTWLPSNINIYDKKINAFYNISDCLINQIISDNAIPIILPVTYCRDAIKSKNQEKYLNGLLTHIKFLHDLSKKYNVPFLNTQKEINTDDYIDICHVNKNGNLKKATLLTPIIDSLLNS